MAEGAAETIRCGGVVNVTVRPASSRTVTGDGEVVAVGVAVTAVGEETAVGLTAAPVQPATIASTRANRNMRTPVSTSHLLG